jgi:hypothetical protein
MISTASSMNPQDTGETPTTYTTVITPTIPTPTTISTNGPAQLTATTNTHTPTINTNLTSATINSTTTFTRTLLVDNISTANPNDVETFAIRSRQIQRGTKFRSVPDTPSVSQPYTHIGYFDVKVKLEKSDDPWDELIDSTKEIFVQLWKMDPSIKIFIYERSARFHDASFIANVADF